jgi:hypothetical protein
LHHELARVDLRIRQSDVWIRSLEELLAARPTGKASPARSSAPSRCQPA